MSVYSLPGYDAWATAGPPEREYVCPVCGADAEDTEELTIVGLTNPAVYRCECGALVADGAFVDAEDYHRP